MVPLSFANNLFHVIDEAALFWPQQQALLVADLHLEKASFYARYGQMLPPYDSIATLQRVEQAIVSCGAKRVICLGDNYHDNGGETRLTAGAADILRRLTATYDWLWVSGNHDDALCGSHGGTVASAFEFGNIRLCHEAEPAATIAEISGHHHPCVRIAHHRRSLSRRCFVRSSRHLIMPAFGSLTGSLDAAHPAIAAVTGPGAEALVATSQRLLSFPCAASDLHQQRKRA